MLSVAKVLFLFQITSFLNRKTNSDRNNLTVLLKNTTKFERNENWAKNCFKINF